jgi:hypothetical protein
MPIECPKCQTNNPSEGLPHLHNEKELRVQAAKFSLEVGKRVNLKQNKVFD